MQTLRIKKIGVSNEFDSEAHLLDNCSSKRNDALFLYEEILLS